MLPEAWETTFRARSMLLINLLPPELRKKRGGTDFNPIVLAVAASFALSLAPAGTWAWLKFSRIPASEAALAELQTTLEAKTAEAAAVEQLRAQIDEFKRHRDLVVGLLAQKVYWARTLDEFANALAGPWPSFEVCCTDVQIQPAAKVAGGEGSPRKGDSVSAMFKGRYKIVGEKRQEAGDYVNRFFTGIESGPFWKGQGFQGKPEQTYRGDTPNWNSDLQRVTIEFSLDWQRMKLLTPITKGGK